MNSFVTRAAIALAANAVALFLAAALLQKVRVSVVFFPFLVILFTVISLVVAPIVTAVVRDKAPAIASLAGLIATWAALLITDLATNRLQIEGFVTWIIATAIVWAAALVVQYLAPIAAKQMAPRA